MELTELKVRMRLSETDTSQDAYLQTVLDDAIDYVKQYCNNDFAEGIPGGVKRAIVILVRGAGENPNVASQSLGDMSKSFFQGGTMTAAHAELKPYRKVRFRAW